MTEMNELLKKISRRLCHISIKDMSRCETLIARDLKDAGYLEEVDPEDPSYKLTKKAEGK
jgi:hypothetical protein